MEEEKGELCHHSKDRCSSLVVFAVLISDVAAQAQNNANLDEVIGKVIAQSSGNEFVMAVSLMFPLNYSTRLCRVCRLY